MRNKTDKYFFKEVDGKISMFHPTGYRIPDEEPILIFRAKDLGVLTAIAAYLNMLIDQEPSKTIKDHIESMLLVTDSILEYQERKNVKSVTCSIEAHRTTVKYLRDEVNKAVLNAKEHLKDVYGVSE